MIAIDDADIREWRKRLGLSQCALAAKLQYSDRRVRDWETGVDRPPETVLLALAAIEGGLQPKRFKDAA